VKKIKVLNLYAGIGGNRKLWPDNIEVTAVEMNEEIANIYKDFFPQDKIIIGDAHQFLLENYKKYDFIWSSPPCPTHSITNNFLNAQGVVRYPDMTLYQEIILIQKFCKTKYCIENVKPYYEPLIKAQECGRHLYWTNFYINDFKENRDFNVLNAKGCSRMNNGEYLKKLEKIYDYDLTKYSDICNEKKVKMLRNCVNPKLGLHIFNCAFRNDQLTLI
jgi:DNA (cytosine-5)-methyltransferase 1